MFEEKEVEDFEEEEDIQIGINIFILGNTEVGKTNFISRYIDNKFNLDYFATKGLQIKLKPTPLKIDDKEYIIKFFDTPGNINHKQYYSKYIQKAHGFIIMYDITNKDSFDAIKSWIQVFKDIKGNNYKKFPLTLLGNKNDLDTERKVKEEDGEKFVKDTNVDFLEISIKSWEDKEDIDNVVTRLVKKIVENMPKEIDDFSGLKSKKRIEYLDNNQNIREKNGCCC